jgi:hypothetical protein
MLPVTIRFLGAERHSGGGFALRHTDRCSGDRFLQPQPTETDAIECERRAARVFEAERTRPGRRQLIHIANEVETDLTTNKTQTKKKREGEKKNKKKKKKNKKKERQTREEFKTGEAEKSVRKQARQTETRARGREVARPSGGVPSGLDVGHRRVGIDEAGQTDVGVGRRRHHQIPVRPDTDTQHMKRRMSCVSFICPVLTTTTTQSKPNTTTQRLSPKVDGFAFAGEHDRHHQPVFESHVRQFVVHCGVAPRQFAVRLLTQQKVGLLRRHRL